MGEFIEPGVISEFKVTPEVIQAGIDYYRENKKNLISNALQARDRAVSYRNFHVGCSLIALHPDHEHFGIYSGFNNKPEDKAERGKDKRCAERQTMEEAVEVDNCKFISVFITVSKEKSTGDENRSDHDALHPCLDCRLMLRELLAKGVLNDETLFCGVNDSAGKEDTEWRVEEKSLKDLLGLYHDDFDKI